MQQRDLAVFSELLDAIWGLKGAPAPTAVQKAMFFRALQQHPLEEVRAGLHAHLRDPKRGQFLPMPADVIGQIQGIVANDGRPGPEEAWATCFRGMDETATIVWTGEMAEAFGIARPLLQAGDEVGARVAFKEVYQRMLVDARTARKPPVWSASLGHDLQGRNAALLPHVNAGRLPQSLLLEAPSSLDAVMALPAPTGESESTRIARGKARETLMRMRAEQAARAAAPSVAEAERDRMRALKAEAAEMVEAKLASRAVA